MSTIDDVAQAALRALMQRTTLPIWAEDGQGNCYLCGNGCLYADRDRDFFVTATHIFRDVNDPSSVLRPEDAAIPVSSSGTMWTLGEGTLFMSEKYDVALYELTGSTLQTIREEGHLDFLTPQNVWRGGADSYVVFGYPAARQKQMWRTVTAPTFEVHAKRRAPPATNDGLRRPVTDHDLFLEWNGADALQGISGSPIFVFLTPDVATSPDEHWHPHASMRVAAVEGSIMKGSWIRGTTWNIVDAMIDQVIAGKVPNASPA